MRISAVEMLIGVVAGCWAGNRQLTKNESGCIFPPVMMTRIYHNYQDFESSSGSGGLSNALAIGMFDGVHLGHQRVLTVAREQAARLGGDGVVMTFRPHPALLLGKGSPSCLTPSELFSDLLGEQGMGMDAIIFQQFSHEFAGLSAEDFFSQVIVAGIKAGAVIVGDNFRFGHNRSADADDLVRLGREAGVAVTVIPTVGWGEMNVSSTVIRNLIGEGKVELASSMLGRPYRLWGQVVPGAGRGAGLGYPTANIQVTEDQLLPADGVYACRGRISGVEGMLDGVLNVGSNPTFGGSVVSAEVHFLDLPRMKLYGHQVQLDVMARIRQEMMFAGVMELRAQIAEDIQSARRLLLNLAEGDGVKYSSGFGNGNEEVIKGDRAAEFGDSSLCMDEVACSPER